MKKVVAVLAFLVAVGAYAQINGGPNGSGGGGVSQLLAGTGISLSPAGGTGNVTVTNTGAAPGFSNLTSGTNTSAAMVVGAGSTLGINYTGQTAATNINGFVANNSTPSTATLFQWMCVDIAGTGWGTTPAVSQEADWQLCVEPSTGNNAATAGSKFIIQGQSNSAGYAQLITLDSNVPGIGAEVLLGSTVVGGAFATTGSTCVANGIDTPATNTVGLCANGAVEFTASTSAIIAKQPLQSGGTIFAYASGTGACATTSTLVGGGQAGNITCTGTTGASTLVLTLAASTTAYSCWTRDITTGADTGAQTGAVSTTSVTFTYTAVAANDVIQFGCLGY